MPIVKGKRGFCVSTGPEGPSLAITASAPHEVQGLFQVLFSFTRGHSGYRIELSSFGNRLWNIANWSPKLCGRAVQLVYDNSHP